MTDFCEHKGANQRTSVVALVGASGAVGVELARCLAVRHFPVSVLKLFASARSAGKSLSFRGLTVKVEELDEYIVRGVDLALFSTADSSISKRYAPIAARSGAGR